MLVIRFFRVGKKNQPSFKIVVADKRNPTRAGRFTEEVGFWNPTTKEKVLKTERIKYWISVGAKPSPTVFNLLISEKIIEGKKIAKHKKSKKKVEAKPVEPVPASVKPVEEKPKEEVKTEAVLEEIKPVEEVK
jgi:small subunit ribosomal protein S16